MRDDNALVTMLLVSRLARRGLVPFKAAEFWALCDRVGQPRVLLGCSQHDLISRHDLPPELATRVVALIDRATALAFEVDALEQSGISTVTAFDTHYPRRFRTRLGPRSPPILHAAGSLELLDRPGVGVVGSRDVPAAAADVARAVAGRVVKSGLPLVSRDRSGLDQLAASEAVRLGGCSVTMLADPLQRTVRRPDVRRALHGGRVAMCTPYGPDEPFADRTALGRNKLVYAHSLATVVVACSDRAGSTWAGATEALGEAYGRVAVWRGPGAGPGNAHLQDLGAVAITSPDALLELIDDR